MATPPAIIRGVSERIISYFYTFFTRFNLVCGFKFLYLISTISMFLLSMKYLSSSALSFKLVAFHNMKTQLRQISHFFI